MVDMTVGMFLLTCAPLKSSTTHHDPQMAATLDKPPQKFLPLCRTQEEALSLIEAYRETWYELYYSNVRTTDWHMVAATMGICCPGASLGKTSAQCRHKIEKLQQR
ncbi:hypothetical protein RJ639_029997 [Escallonia herrerae]|uniref:Uncharacterized protein n=1 Tax=Escallonia herrerae TaxID=1293975 RepID=A0AA88WZ87_9ASTE|nr:hypothetical protein RJ639_029997 [Escallonia herrerae]